MKTLHFGRAACVACFACVVAPMAILAACDGTSSGIIAGLGGAPNDSAGRQRLVVSPGTLSIAAGSTFQLSTNAPTTLQNLLQWSAVNQTVASVSPTGTVFGAAAGTTAITVRYSDDTTNVGTMTLTVVGTGNTGERAAR